MEAKRQAIRHRAAALEAAEAQRKFQEATLGRQAEEAGGPNQDRFLQQLTGRVHSLIMLKLFLHFAFKGRGPLETGPPDKISTGAPLWRVLRLELLLAVLHTDEPQGWDLFEKCMRTRVTLSLLVLTRLGAVKSTPKNHQEFYQRCN